MKKTMCVLWLLAALALLLSGCQGGADTEQSTAPSASQREAESSMPDPEPAPAEPEGPVYEHYDWQFGAPEEHGMDGSLLSRLHDVLPEEIHAVLVVRGDVIVDEYYGEGYDENSVFRLASCTKSLMSALIGIAIDEELIDGVDAPIAQYFPQVAGTEKQDITIRHLLEHTSGIEWDEWDGGPGFWQFRTSEHWVNHVLDKEMAAQPGETFNYSSGGSHLLSAILQQATGTTTLEYAVEHLFAPMGMTSVEWGSDPQGITAGGSGTDMTARDAAKFGQLYLNGGLWEGRQLVPEHWVEASTAVQFARSGRSGSYGYQWWVRPFEGYDTYYAMGHGGQYIFVVPQLELVTVITSTYDDTYAPWPFFTDYILAACAAQ